MSSRFSPLVVHTFFEALGYVVAVAIYFVQRRRMGDVLDGTTRYAVTLGAGIGAMAGARLLAALCDPVRTMEGLAAGQFLFGKTIVGALLGGLVAVELVKRRLGVRAATGDEIALSLIAGIAVGRVGCFIAGVADDTAGLPSNVAWAVTGTDGITRHPVALYEIGFLLLLAVPVQWVRSEGRRGDAFKLFLAAYLLFRFVCDFLKPMPPRIYGGISAIQIAALCGMAWYAGVFARRWRRAVEV